MVTQIQLAIKNIDEEITRLMRLDSSNPQIYVIDNTTITYEKAKKQIRAGTKLGKRLIRIWAKPRKEVEREIDISKANLLKTR